MNGQQKQLDEKPEQKIIQQEQTIHFSGPLPPPQILEQYNKIIPGSAERIIKMAEQQATHRMALEKTDSNNSKKGVYFAFIIGVTGITGAVILGLFGQQASAGILGGGTLVSLVGAFIYGTKSKKK